MGEYKTNIIKFLYIGKVDHSELSESQNNKIMFLDIINNGLADEYVLDKGYPARLNIDEFKKSFENNEYKIGIIGNEKFTAEKSYFLALSACGKTSSLSNIFFVYYIYDLNEAMQIINILHENNKISIDKQTEIKLTNDFSDIKYYRY